MYAAQIPFKTLELSKTVVSVHRFIFNIFLSSLMFGKCGITSAKQSTALSVPITYQMCSSLTVKETFVYNFYNYTPKLSTQNKEVI